MLQKLTIPAALIASLLLGGCMKLPEEPPLLASSKAQVEMSAVYSSPA